MNAVNSAVRGQPNYSGVIGTVRGIVAHEGPKYETVILYTRLLFIVLT